MIMKILTQAWFIVFAWFLAIGLIATLLSHI